MPLTLALHNPGGDIHPNPTVVEVDFNIRLQHRPEGDFHVFAAEGMTSDTQHVSEIAQAVLSGLLADESCGVHSVRVQPYRLIITHSRAVSDDHIQERIDAILVGMDAAPLWV